MLSSPKTITIDTVDKVLTRIREDRDGSLYRLKDTTETIEVRIRHSTSSQDGYTLNRHNIFWTHKVYATDTTPEYFWSVSITLSERDGSDPTYLSKTMAGLHAGLASDYDTIAIGDV
jgi:hypothetical protein